MTKEELKPGQDVHYVSGHGRVENGRVKVITEHAVFVVYNCAGDWDNYGNYTGASTNPLDLLPGWDHFAANANLTTKLLQSL